VRAFAKYEGLGNDFIVIDEEISSEEAIKLCDRRFGIGGDGVLLVLPSRDPSAVARMKVINADGSVPEMCGNGLRCVALHVAKQNGEIAVDTDAGIRRCTVEGDMITVAMGTVRLLGDKTIEVERSPVTVSVADVGNPHAVMFGLFARREVDHLGPRIATHAAFPAGINVEFARVEPEQIELVVWERGVGVTHACGTGACATVAVACAKRLVPYSRPIGVHLPGGRLEITVEPDGRAIMKGPARRVFQGTLG
jgi:diaminopimelate epimerase